MANRKPRLYTFQVSHFAEKARWALDYKGVVFEERRLLPGPHVFVTRRLGPKTTVPLLVRDGEVVQGSSAIFDYVDRCWPERLLTPAEPEAEEQARELERFLDSEIGKPLRRIFYHYALREPALVADLFTQGGPRWGKAFYKVGFGLVANRIRAMYRIDARNVAEDRDRVARAIERIDALLQRGRYLVGDGFTRADLTLAALTAPACDPPEHSTKWPSSDAYPRELREFRSELSSSATCQHVRRMYRDHRGRSSL